MPIKPENRALYPKNWKTEIRPRILARANNCCERCCVKNHDRVFRFVDQCGYHFYMTEIGAVFDAEDGELCGYARITDMPAGRFVSIVLTIAHIHDHDPANCADDNLAALCQRCHLQHDRPMHRAHAAATRRAKSAYADLFAIQEQQA